jgi:predicted ATPase
MSRVELVGRSEELRILSQMYERTLNGSSEVCIVDGQSGVGKTAMINAGLRDYIARGNSKGLFAHGKFEQQLGLPHAAIVSCFADLVDLISQHHNVNEIRESIRLALGSEIKILLRLVNNLRFLFDEVGDSYDDDQHSLVVLPQALNHLKLLCRLFIAAIARAAHPVVLYFDDIQWADRGSRDVIEALIGDTVTSNIIIVVCFREECTQLGDAKESHEPDEKAYKRTTLQEACGLPQTHIHVDCLQGDDVNTLISDLLRCQKNETISLSDVIQKKTLGNVHHVLQFIESLQSRGMLKHCPQRDTWDWSIKNILADTNVSENVLSLITRRLQQMGLMELDHLRSAAFLGYSFNSEFIVELIAADKGSDSSIATIHTIRTEVLQSLRLAVKEMLVEETDGENMYVFTHDTVHQALYESLDNQLETMKVHLKIGRTLLDRLLREQSEDYALFLMATDHLNKGKDMITDPVERVALATLNLQAAKVSALRSTYHTEFLDHAVSLLAGVDRWEVHYDLYLDLVSTASEHSLSSGRHEKARSAATEVIHLARTPQDKGRAYNVLIHVLGSEGRFSEASTVARDALRAFEEPFPRKVAPYHAILELGRVCKTLKSMTDERLRTLPLMEDKRQQAILKILGTLSCYAFYSEEKWVLAYTSYRTVYLSLRDGITELTPQSFVLLGATFGRISGHRKATKFGRLGVNMLQRMNAPAAHAWTAVLFHTTINHWQRPLEESIEPLVRSYELGAKAGDHYFSLSAGIGSVAMAFYCGQPLVHLEEDLRFLAKRAVEMNRGQVVAVVRTLLQLLQNLLGRSDNPLILSGDTMNEEDMIADNLATRNQLGARYLNFARLILFVHMANWVACAGLIQQVLKNEKSSPLEMNWISSFYCGVASFELAKRTRRRRYRTIGRTIVKRMAAWVDAGVVNCEPLLLILKAEEMATLARAPPSKVLEAYDEAIASCRVHNVPHYEALSNERAADSLIADWQYSDARGYAKEAYSLHETWQCDAKLQSLSTKYLRFGCGDDRTNH